MTQVALEMARQTLELSKETMKAACKQIDELKAENKALKETLAVDKESLTTPPQRTWVGLTDEEIKPCWYEACQTDLELTSQLVVYFAKAIEAKLKEKNT